MTTVEAREQQRVLYGAPLAELAAEVTDAFGMTQGRLAGVLGLSAPMLSQLLSGQRVKIGNPAVVHRLEALLALARRAEPMSQPDLAQRLEEISTETSTLTADAGSEVDHAARALARVAGAGELRAAAGEVSSTTLAAVLRRAAATATRG